MYVVCKSVMDVLNLYSLFCKTLLSGDRQPLDYNITIWFYYTSKIFEQIHMPPSILIKSIVITLIFVCKNGTKLVLTELVSKVILINSNYTHSHF